MPTAVEFFLKVDGIPGESLDSKHRGEIDVLSFSFGETNTGSAAHGGSGAAAGKVSMQDFHFTMKINKASPTLFLKGATGGHIKQAVLTARKAGGEVPLEFLKVVLTDVLVSSFQTGGSAGADLPTDQVSLNFAKIQMTFQPQGPAGQPVSPVTVGFDLKSVKF